MIIPLVLSSGDDGRRLDDVSNFTKKLQMSLAFSPVMKKWKTLVTNASLRLILFFIELKATEALPNFIFSSNINLNVFLYSS